MNIILDVNVLVKFSSVGFLMTVHDLLVLFSGRIRRKNLLRDKNGARSSYGQEDRGQKNLLVGASMLIFFFFYLIILFYFT
jgi:hypothetical protein